MKKILAIALTCAIAFGVTSLAQAGEETQKEEFKIKPTKLSKKKPQNIKFVNTITTSDVPGTNQPPKATRTVLDLPKQFKINNKKFAYCKTDEAGLQAAPTVAEAKKACGKKSLVSDDAGSSAQVKVGNPVGNPTIIDVDVLAFNENGNKLLLYSKPSGAFSGIAASILVGKLKNSKSGSAYGKALDVAIPPLSAGAISFFEVTIPKSKYIQAKCKPKKLKAQATTTFSDAPKSSDTHTVKCKPKKKKK